MKETVQEMKEVVQEMKGVVKDNVGPIAKYRPAKDKDGINPHVWRHVKILALFIVVFLPLCIIGLDWSTYIDPLNPKMNQVRFAVIITTTAVLKFLGLSGFVIFLELVTNGNLIGQAISTSYGAAGFGFGVIIAAALILM